MEGVRSDHSINTIKAKHKHFDRVVRQLSYYELSFRLLSPAETVLCTIFKFSFFSI